jgi:hypothetical protein
MSLINDALKKAARQRSEEQAELAPSALGTGGRKRIPRRGAPMTVQTLVLIVAGAAVLVVGSVVVTIVLLTGKSESRLAQEARSAPPATVTPSPPPLPAVVVNVPARPAPPPPTAAPVVQEIPTPTPAPVVVEAARVPPKPVVALSRAEQIQNFIDSLRVTGVRTAGTDGKALVDGHVYRVNDILDRNLGLKLQKVDADHLTLVDSAGTTYIKNF